MEEELDLLELLELLRKRIKLVILLPLLSAIIVGVGSLYLPNKFTASTTMYVLSRADDNVETITQSDLSAGQMISSDVSTILQSDRVKNDVAEELGLESLSPFKLSVTSSTNTRVITLSVTGVDPEQTAAVANALVADTSEVATEVMQIESVNVIDKANVPVSPSGPNRPRYAAIGLLAGLVAAVGLVVIENMLDTRIHSGKDVEAIMDVPVIGHFPAIEVN